MSISMAWIAQIMKLNQFTSETIQNALQELIKSGRVKASICRPDFTDACNELLSLNFFTEEGQLHVINTLSQLNGNFVANIIRKGLTALRKVYNDCKTFEDESIKLVDLCLSFYQKQGRDATGTTPSPALLVECTAELCDELLKRTSDGGVNILLSKCLVILMDIYGKFLNARLSFPDLAKQLWSPICHFKNIFDALKPRINKEFYEELLEQTSIIARKDKELNYMNSRSICGKTTAILMEPWKKLLEFSFVTNWFAVQTAKQDILLHDQEHAGQCSNVMTYSQSLIINIVEELQTLHPQDCNFKIHNDKKRLQIFFSHPEIIVICTKPCVQLLQSHITTKCMDEIFQLLENKNNRVVLKSSISAESKFFEEQFKQLQNGKLTMVTATDIENLSNNWKIMRYYNQQFLENEEIKRNLTLALTKVAEALLSLPAHQPVIDILTFWKRAFTDNKYCTLTHICLLVHAVISLGQQEIVLNMEKLVLFLVQVPQHLLQTMPFWHSILADLIKTFPDSWNSKRTFIEHFTDKLESLESIVKTQNVTQFVERVFKSSLTETTKNELFELAWDLYVSIPLVHEYQFALNGAIHVVSGMDIATAKSFLLEFLDTVRGTPLDYKNACSVLELIEKSSVQEKREMFQCYSQLLGKVPKDKINEVLMISRELMCLPVDSHNARRLLEFVEKEELRSYTNLIFQCASILNDHNTHFVNNLITLTLDVMEKTLSSGSEREQYSRAFQNYFGIVTSCDGESCILLLACIAGSIAVGNFEEDLNDLAIMHTSVYLDIHKADAAPFQPIHALALYMRLFQAFKKVKCNADGDHDYINNFSAGLKSLLKLPLRLVLTLTLVNRIVNILDKVQFNHGQVWLIMSHLFTTHEDNEAIVSEPRGFWKHFSKAVTPSIVKELSVMPIICKQSTEIRGDTIMVSTGKEETLLNILVKKSPQSFAEGTSSELMKFIIKRLKKKNALPLSMCFLPLANVFIRKNATVTQFKNDFKEVEKMLCQYISSSGLILLISECITEYYHVHFTDEQPIKQLAKLFLETNWKHDLKQVYACISSYLNIPRQLVFAFQEAPDKEKHHAIKRVLDVLDVLRQHDPKFLFGDFGQNIENKKFLQTLAEYDFKMLMRESSLEPQEVCNILHVYSTSELSNYISLFSDGNACTDKDCKWSTEYTKSDPLTPGKLAFLILKHLKKMNIDEELLQRETLTIFNQLLRNSIDPLRLWFSQQSSNFNEYIEFFFNIMKISLSLSEIKQLLIDVPSSHCAVKCKDVILATFLWKSGNKDEVESLRMVKKILPALVDQQKVFVQVAMESPHLQVLAKILNSVEHEEIIDNLLKLLFVSIPSTAACVDTIVGWSKEESLALVKKFQDQYQGLQPKEVQALDNKLNLWLQMLPFVSNVFPNSAKNVGDYFDNMIDNNQLDDPQSLTRIPIWFKEMTNSKFSRQIIESWCTSLIFYPNLSSRDVDAIVNLTPSTIHLITKKPGEIEECLFNEPAPKTWHETMKESIAVFKRCLQFAKILNEFTSIALLFKENSQIMGKIQEGTHKLCRYLLENQSLFKVRYNVLKELFCILFSGEAVTNEHLTTHNKLCTSLVTVFRRLARSISVRPVLFGHVKTIVHQTLQKHGHSKDLQELLNAIHKHVLELEPNQGAIHFLQASGYNQGALEEDLWYSTSIQLPSYVPAVKSIQKVRTQRLLKQMLREWRCILMDLEITEVEVNGQKIKSTDLMNYSDSSETMESQLDSIKNATQNASPHHWSYDRRRQLIQKEKYVRRSIKEDANQGIVDAKLTKMVIVWDNQLLDSVKTCTENIPGCYAPNGFHSEKPVICGTAVDNRILTLYKEEKVNTFTELEDVEVKLYPVGMLVYSVYSRSHCYDTDQLWAAFFKMLLLKRLVPKIFITNVSPGFEWIKNFVKPEASRPEGITFACCNTLIPSTEDSFDYEPNVAVANLNSGIPDNAMDELIILTPDKVQDFKFTTLRSPKRDQLIRKVMENVPQSVKEHSRLLEKHPGAEIREQLIKRLTFAIRKAAELSVDTDIPETEMISNFINLKKLSSGCKDCAIIEENREDFYSEVILDVLRAEIDGNTEYNRDYDCCQHVEFLQSTECTRD